MDRDYWLYGSRLSYRCSIVLTRTGTVGGVAIIDIGAITAVVCLFGIVLNWRRNRSIALGFVGSLISIFIVIPSIIVFGAWLILRNAYF
jgi:hypothetical protein